MRHRHCHRRTRLSNHGDGFANGPCATAGPAASFESAVRAPADTDPTLRNLALAALCQARIAETEAARCRSTAADLLAALEARGQVDG